MKGTMKGKLTLIQKIGLAGLPVALLWLFCVLPWHLLPPNWNYGIGLGLLVVSLACLSGKIKL